MHRVTCNHDLLISSDESDLHLGLREGDDGILAPSDIGLIVELETEIRKILTNSATETAVMLADTAGEDDEIRCT